MGTPHRWNRKSGRMQGSLSRSGPGLSAPAITDVLVLVFLAVISAMMYALFRNFEVDDAFITYRMAWNAAHGLGLVYNQGEQVLVSTTPLFVLALGRVCKGFDTSAIP